MSKKIIKAKKEAVVFGSKRKPATYARIIRGELARIMADGSPSAILKTPVNIGKDRKPNIAEIPPEIPKIKIDPNDPMKAITIEEIIQKRLAEFEQRYQFEKEQAYKSGIDQGKSQGFAEGSRAFNDLKALFAEIENGLGEWRSALIGSLDSTLLRLSVEMAEAIVGEVAIKSAKEMLDYNLQKCLQQLAGYGKARIRINPHDYNLIKDNTDIFRQFVKGKTMLEFTSDATISRGGCLIESDSGDVDGRIESQIGLLKDNFLGLTPN